MNKPGVTGGMARRQAEVRNWLAGRKSGGTKKRAEGLK